MRTKYEIPAIYYANHQLSSHQIFHNYLNAKFSLIWLLYTDIYVVFQQHQEEIKKIVFRQWSVSRECRPTVCHTLMSLQMTCEYVQCSHVHWKNQHT